ncbi:ATP-grasp domain-containing protein [Tersicoccus sp. MR15.9]|uniref:ATP-grasp domain-containing protein n=1 Tax=Tersicoccus mangrovi TaxID=3121635 RepID=UPI002FE65D95
MSGYEKLTVVTSAAWLARDLDAAGVVPVTRDIGLDAPVLDGATALWCPGVYATRMVATGLEHPFASFGPDWPFFFPHRFLRRTVIADRLSDVRWLAAASLPGPVFGKLAEHKAPSAPARVYPSIDAFASRLREVFGDAAEDLQVLVSAPIVFRAEYRCFIAHGQVTAASFYLLRTRTGGEITWDAFETAEQAPPVESAVRFAQQVVDALEDGHRATGAPECGQPDGWVLDVGLDENGAWSVVEPNASWSSNPYHADPAGVVRSILASQDPAGRPDWRWRPDPVLAARVRPFPTSTRSTS